MKAHPTALVSERAEIGADCEIGPFAIIEPDVKIGKAVKIYARAHILSGTRIGEGTEVHMGAVLGHVPQDTAFKGKKSYLNVGKRNIIREYVTVHRGTEELSATEIGDDNFLMAHSHVGHNCRIANKVTLVNGALLAGHVTVEDGVFISGNVVVHQFCRIGKLAIVGGFSGVNKDVPPYMVVKGVSRVRAVNLVGLRRAGFTKEVIKELRGVFRLIYRSGLNTTQAIEKILELDPGKEARYLVDFIKNSKRGICKYESASGNKNEVGDEKEKNREEEYGAI